VSLQELALAAYADIMAADSVIAVVILFILLASLVKESKWLLRKFEILINNFDGLSGF
jgi:putative effector of murein hydrolase LrgA (UPF0299 family)